MRYTPPCKGCEDRIIGCHAVCEKYQDFRKKLDDLKQIVFKGKEQDFIRDSYIAEKKARGK